MSIIRRIAKNTLLLISAEMYSMIVQFIFLIFVTKYLGDTGFGKISFALSFAFIFSVIADAGLNTLIIRELAKNSKNAEKFISNSLAFKIIFGIVLIVIITVLLTCFNTGKEKFLLVLIISFAFIIGNIAQLFRNVFQSFEKMEYEALIKTIYTTAYAIIGFAVIFLKWNILMIGLAYLIGSIINLLFSSAVCYNKFSRFNLRFDKKYVLRLIKEAYPFAISSIFASMFFNIDVLILGYLRGDQIVGWYSLAYRIAAITLIIPSFFNQAIFPLLSKYHEHNKKIFNFAFEKSIKYMLMIALPLALLVTFLAGPVIRFVFGNKFENSIPALQILIWCIVIIYVSSLMVNVINVIGKQKPNMYIYGFNIFINILLDLILIPRFSIYGVAAAVIITQGIGAILTCRLIPRFSQQLRNLKLHKIIIPTLAMAATIYILRYNPILATLSSVCIYITMTILLKTIEQEEIKLLKELVYMS